MVTLNANYLPTRAADTITTNTTNTTTSLSICGLKRRFQKRTRHETYPGKFHCVRAHVSMARWLAHAGTPRMELKEHIIPSPPLSTQLSNWGINVVAQSRRVTLAEKVCRRVSGPPCTTKCLQPAVAATYLFRQQTITHTYTSRHTLVSPTRCKGLAMSYTHTRTRYLSGCVCLATRRELRAHTRTRSARCRSTTCYTLHA